MQRLPCRLQPVRVGGVHEVAEAGAHLQQYWFCDLDGKGYPADDRGLMDITKRPADMGRFRAPTLRNIALTAPHA